MLKKGKLRALRNMPVGWLLHANHARDWSERLTHHGLEAGVLLLGAVAVWAFVPARLAGWWFGGLFFAVHTLWWVVNGNYHVCLLDSFRFVRNAGIAAVLDYLAWSRGWFLRSGQVKAILVYGSFCRCKFHGRSDLDLRVLRKRGWRSALSILPRAVAARLVSLLRGIPTDLQVVDSEAFLLRQMRADEFPVCVYGEAELTKIKVGLCFEDVLKHPDRVLKHEPAAAGQALRGP